MNSTSRNRRDVEGREEERREEIGERRISKVDDRRKESDYEGQKKGGIKKECSSFSSIKFLFFVV